MAHILNTLLKDKDAFLPRGDLQPALLDSAAAPLLRLPCLPVTEPTSFLLNHHQVHRAWSWQHL